MTATRERSRRALGMMLWVMALLAASAAAAVASAAATATPAAPAAATTGRRTISFYSTLQSPAEHPLYLRRLVKPPEHRDFGPSGVGWMALRGFDELANGTLLNFHEKLDQYTAGPDAVSSVLWPNINTVGAPNFLDLVTELNRRNLSLLVGGFVPGGRQQYDASAMLPFAEHLGAAQSMGRRYLGMGQSEQDIRYLWGYTQEAVFGTAPGSGRLSAYQEFRRYAGRIEQLSGNQLFVLARGVFTHYYLDQGLYTIAGAELSGGPPGQLTYAFIRGAAKQHGTLLLSNVCSFTRWGHKIPGDPNPSPSCESGNDHGDTCGTSYSAMKRMLYTLLMYDAATSGFEVYYYYPPPNQTVLSPIGRMQARGKTWVDSNPPASRGVHVVTAAFMLDFLAGWETPCSDPGWTFSTAFGKEKYSAPDFLADGLFDIAWPGYRNAGYFRDASFELSPTPYGDVFDVVLSDVSAKLLARYDTVIVAHSLVTRPLIVRQRLESFVEQGGQLLMAYDSLADLGPGASIANVSLPPASDQDCVLRPGGTMTVALADGSSVKEPHPLVLCRVTPPPGAVVLASTLDGQQPLAFRTQPNPNGGTLTLVALGNYGVTMQPLHVGTACQQDVRTESPQPLALSFQRLASDLMAEQALFDLGGGSDTNLSFVVKHVSGGTDYLLGVSNTQLSQQPLTIRATFGELVSVTEVTLDASEKSEAGYLPHGYLGHDVGHSGNTSIAGADFRMLRVVVREKPGAAPAVRVQPHSIFPRAPSKIWMRLSADEGAAYAAIQKRVGFRTLFEGVLLDAAYVSARSLETLQGEAAALAAQGIRQLGVDLSPAIDMFPGLRLGNFTSGVQCGPHSTCRDGAFFEQSMRVIADVLHKCAAMAGCADVLLTLHKAPELGPSDDVVKTEMTATVQRLVAQASALTPSPVRLHLRQSTKNRILGGATASSQRAWARATSEQLHFAPNSGLAAIDGADAKSLGLSSTSLLLVDGVSDLYLQSRHGTETAPLQPTSPGLLSKIRGYIAAASRANATIVLDPSYEGMLQEEADVLLLERALAEAAKLPPTPPTPPPSPPGPAPPRGKCYQLGAPLTGGICTITGPHPETATITMGCPSTGPSCYADEKLPNGQWARNYNGNFGLVLTAANAASAVTRLTVDGQRRWVITVTTALGSANWTSEQPGYLPPSHVTAIDCTYHRFDCAIKTDDSEAADEGACSSDAACYGGRCRQGACVCPPLWRGAHCETLSLAPAALGSGLQLGNTSSWGGAIVQDTSSKDLWHLYAAMFIDHCGLKSWTSNSEIVHAVSSSVDGPYTLAPVDHVVVPTFAHNPTVSQLGERDFLLAHIGCGNQTKQPKTGCTNGTTCNTTWCEPHTHVVRPGQVATAAAAGVEKGHSCDTPHFSGLHRASTPRGPWRPVHVDGPSYCGLEVDPGPGGWHTPCITNPQFWSFENGSALMAYSTGCANCTVSAGHKHIGLAFAERDPDTGGFKPLVDLTPTKPIFPWASEDPNVFLDTTNAKTTTWHVLAHTDFSGVAEDGHWRHVAAHAIAPTPYGPWTVVPYPPYTRTIEWADGGTTEVYTRERPQLIFSASDPAYKRVPVALSNGVTPGNYTGDYSYTHVQVVRLAN